MGDGGVVDGSQARDDQFNYSRRLSVVLQLVRWTESSRWPETPIRAEQAGGLANALVTTEMRTWASATRAGRLERDLLGFAFTTPEARGTWERLGRPSMFTGPPSPQAIAPNGADHYNIGYIPLTRRELFEFPTDPQAIYERLRAVRPEQRAAATVFQQLQSAIGIQARPELRAGIYHAFALLPGVRIDADATDAIGRHGTAIRFVRDDQDTDREQQLILDTHSYELLGERVAIVDAAASSLDVNDGTITTETVCIRAVTDEPAAP